MKLSLLSCAVVAGGVLGPRCRLIDFTGRETRQLFRCLAALVGIHSGLVLSSACAPFSCRQEEPLLGAGMPHKSCCFSLFLEKEPGKGICRLVFM